MSTVLKPKLNTVNRPRHQMGIESFNLLLEQMNCHKLNEPFVPRTISTDTTVIARESSLKKTITNHFRKSIFRFSPKNFVLFRGESLNTALKVSSVISSQSFLVIDNKSGLALNKGSLCGLENLFQGQTS
jgi:ribonuclease HIII